MKLLVTGAWSCTLQQLNKLKELGHQVVYLQNEKDPIPCNYCDIEGVICNGLFLYHDIKKFTSLSFIQVTSAGLDKLPLDYIKEHKIKLYNAKGVYSIPMAEFAIGGILQLYKKTKIFTLNKQNHIWEKNRNLLELYGKKVFIIGCGDIGTECAKRLKAFGTSITGFDVLVISNEYYNEIHHINTLQDYIQEADIVILTLPLNEQTHNLFNQPMFDLMKNGSLLVNISRGKIVNEKALLQVLDNKLMGAVLDVFEEEPLSTSNPLWEKENVILTPHNSFVGDGNNNRLSNLIFKNLGEQ